MKESRPVNTPPYKSDRNQYFTASLFYEQWMSLTEDMRTIDPVFSLHHDRPGLVNARTTFVDLGDPTGYKWAMKYLGEWEHFCRLEKTKWFAAALEIWRAELDIKIKSEAMDIIREIASGGTPAALVAAKFLATEDYKKRSGAGRPSKAEVTGALKKATEALSIEDEDAARIGLRLVK